MCISWLIPMGYLCIIFKDTKNKKDGRIRQINSLQLEECADTPT